MATVLRLKAEGVAVLLVEQNVASALAVADRVCVMRGGLIVYEGSAQTMRADTALQRRWLGV
jgi:branched-chain amino acid transport system ATP-binding protein